MNPAVAEALTAGSPRVNLVWVGLRDGDIVTGHLGAWQKVASSRTSPPSTSDPVSLPPPWKTPRPATSCGSPPTGSPGSGPGPTDRRQDSVPEDPVSEEVVLRQARDEEADILAGLWLRARAAAAPAIPPAVHSDVEVRAWFADVVLPTRKVWLAQDSDGAVLGLLVLDGAILDQLYVDPARTGRGIGSRLLDLARSRRPGGLSLWTFQANAGARRFYERHGLRPVAETGGDNEEGTPDVRYRWEP